MASHFLANTKANLNKRSLPGKNISRTWVKPNLFHKATPLRLSRRIHKMVWIHKFTSTDLQINCAVNSLSFAKFQSSKQAATAEIRVELRCCGKVEEMRQILIDESAFSAWLMHVIGRLIQHHTTAETIVRRTYSERNGNSLPFTVGNHDWIALK